MCIVAESLYLTLLFTGGALMTLELFPCFSIMNKLKLSAFAAMCTALSGTPPPRRARGHRGVLDGGFCEAQRRRVTASLMHSCCFLGLTQTGGRGV